MKEVEILVNVLSNKEDSLEKLSGFNFVGIKKVLDVYFYDPKREDLKPLPDGRLKNCFRLRKKDDKFFMAYKLDHFDEQGVWVYSDEHEVEISDFDTTVEILKHLGLEILVEIENEKHTYLTDKYEIVFEDVKNLGLFLEVEALGVSDSDDIAAVKSDIGKFIKSLGVAVGDDLNLGKPELMVKKLMLK